MILLDNNKNNFNYNVKNMFYSRWVVVDVSPTNLIKELSMWSKTIQEVKEILSRLLRERKKTKDDLSIIDGLIKDLRTELQQRKGV